MKLKPASTYKDTLQYPSLFKNVDAISSMETAEDELWKILKMLTNGYQSRSFLETRIKKVKKVHTKALSEFIRQAESFYMHGVKAHYKIAPLMHYYSMLNLAKAFILIRRPAKIIPRLKTLEKKNLYHGLGAGDRIKLDYDFWWENIEIQEEGVFSNLFYYLTGKTVSSIAKGDRQLLLRKLLSYCSDVSLEHSHVFPRDKNLLPLEAEVRVQNKKAKKAWVFLKIDQELLKKTTQNSANLLKRNPELSGYRRVVSTIKGEMHLEGPAFGYSNYKSLRIKSAEALQRLCLSDSNEKGNFHLPLTDPDIRNLLPEPLIIYAIMYYLGSIVRYQPYTLNIFGTQEGWLLESFIKTCPKKFLAYMTSYIFDTKYYINSI